MLMFLAFFASAARGMPCWRQAECQQVRARRRVISAAGESARAPQHQRYQNNERGLINGAVQ